MPELIKITVADSSVRADKLVAGELEELSRSAVQRLFEEKLVVFNNKPVSKSAKLPVGAEVEVTLPDLKAADVAAENIPLDIVYEDADLLVVNKPKGMVVHPAPGNYSGTLVNALLYHCAGSLSGIGGVQRPGIVHRIDKDTSGLLMVAKNDAAHIGLSEQIKAHSFTRKYKSIVYGNIKDDAGTIDMPIGRSQKDRKKMAVVDLPGVKSRNAVTHYKVLNRYKGFTEIDVALETGRTHQIRVHMAYIGHPVAGDPVYGPKKVITSLNGQCLHAALVGFVHPKTGEYMEFTSPPPEYFTKFVSGLDSY